MNFKIIYFLDFTAIIMLLFKSIVLHLKEINFQLLIEKLQ